MSINFRWSWLIKGFPFGKTLFWGSSNGDGDSSAVVGIGKVGFMKI